MRLIQQGADGPEVVELKRLLNIWGRKHPLPQSLAETAHFGAAAVAAVQAFQRANRLDDDGRVGDLTWAALERLEAGAGGRPRPPLPASFLHAAVPPYVTGSGWMGLQPWIVPQAKAICTRFGLQVTAGFGGHPPHAEHSDHGWGGAVDLGGPMASMVECNLWADRYCADPHSKGMVFRWVGGPAKDSTGVEPHHENHVHLSWYREGPPTTIFDTREFRSGRASH